MGGSLAITGSSADASLNIAISGGRNGDGISAAGDVSVTDCSVTTNGYGGSVYSGIHAGGSLIIEESDVRSVSGYYAISAGSLIINDDTQDIMSMSEVVITANGKITWEGNYSLWVGETQVSTHNADDVLGDGTVSYDADTNTLTLKGATIDIPYEDTWGITYGIYADGDLNLELEGTNTVQGSDGQLFRHGVYSEKNLTVSGDGSLTAKAETDGIYAHDNITISGGSISGEGTGYGVYVCKDLTVSGGSVTGVSTDSDGIYVGYNNGDLTVNDGSVSGTAYGSGYGIQVGKGGISINGGSDVTAKSGTAGHTVEIMTNFYDIYVNGINVLPSAEATEFVVSGGQAGEGVVFVKADALYVNGIDILNAPDHEVTCGDGLASYDPATNTLTLDGAYITAPYDYGRTCGIYADGPLNINLIGENTVENPQAAFSCGVFVNDNLIVSGTGSLTSKAEEYGIYAQGNMTVNGGSVTGSGTNYGVYVQHKALTVSGGSVTGTADGSGIGAGIYANALRLSDGDISGTCANGYGVSVYISDIIVDGGSITGTATGQYGSGIYVESYLKVNGGSVTGTAAGESEWGINAGPLVMTSGTVTAKGGNAAIVNYLYNTHELEELMVLPKDYMPVGYEAQTVFNSNYTYASFVNKGETLGYDGTDGRRMAGAVTEITLKEIKRPSGSGGNTGSNTVTNADGSTTETVNKSDGTVIETTKKPNGDTTVVETKPDGSSQITITNTDGSASTTIVKQDGQVESKVELPESVLENAAEKGEAVKLPMPSVSNTDDRDSAPTITVDLPEGVVARVEIPVDNVTPGTVAVLVEDDGTEKVIKTTVPTENGVTVTVSGGDIIKIVDNSHPFDDVPASYWGYDAVAFVTGRELFNGTGENTFEPVSNMTRAMMVTILYRLENEPEAYKESGFTDVAEDSWYEDAVAWAAENGIVNGFPDETYGPELPITREQMAAILYRYAGYKGYDVGEAADLSGYTDAGDISGYAAEAMAWANAMGIITGRTETTLVPSATATRAEAAAILMRFCENVVK